MPLPQLERIRVGFDQTFENSARKTIALMDSSGNDIASQHPQYALSLPKMGVTRQSVPVQIANPLGVGDDAHLACDVAVHVDLSKNRRGIHVSRLGDVIARCTNNRYHSLTDYAVHLAEEVRKTQHSATAQVEIQGVFSYLEKIEGVKTKVSLESLKLSAEAHLSSRGLLTSTGVGFNHITACPCVQETYRHSFGAQSEEFVNEIGRREMPLLTHSQRCSTNVVIRGNHKPVSLVDLLNCIDGVVVRSQNTMPREFELLTVFKAHQKAQFLEDVLRDLLVACRELLRDQTPKTILQIRSVSYESIHDFDLDGEIVCTLAELDQLLLPS